VEEIPMTNTDIAQFLYSEVEFKDMDHTLEWLLKIADKYHCDEAVKLLKEVRVLILLKKGELFEQP
jgi:hypothetical protein